MPPVSTVNVCASRATVCRNNDSSTHSCHRSRLNSNKNPSSSVSQQQKVHSYIPDSCDHPELEDIPLTDLGISKEEYQRQNSFEEYQRQNSFEDTYNVNNLKVITRKGISVPVQSFPESFIQWPIEGSTKSKRIAEIKKQVKLLGNIIKMTVSPINQNGSEGSHGGSISIPPPFSQLVEMSRIPAVELTSVDDGSAHETNWEDISKHIQAARLKEAKTVLRDAEWNMSSTQREGLWRNLCIYQATDKNFSDYYYVDTVKQIYGTTELSECHIQLPHFVDVNHCEKRGLSQLGAIACERIISVIAYSNPTITYAPSIYTITSTLLHYMEEHDAYNCINALISGSQNKFVTQTKMCNETSWRATMMLAKKHIRGSFSTLGKFGVTTIQLEEAFQKWQYWILEHLPLPHLVRILDCFLLEGSKVLMRCALAIFQMFVKAVTRDSSLAASLPSRGVSDGISRFCQGLQISPNKLLKTAFGIRGFSKAEINNVVHQMEMMVKSERDALGDSEDGIAYKLGRSSSLEGLPSSEMQANIQMMSHTLTIKELLQVWSWLPVRITMNQPQMVYTTEEHGSSLTTFYLRCQKYAPTLLLIRTTKDYVFGAYLSSPWATRNKTDEYGNRQTYFGTGECFLFSLRPQSAKYEWVGINHQYGSGGSVLEHSSELFMHADNSMLSIGGGGGQGIQLDQELYKGKTEWCQTFNNPPLCPESDFEVKVIEVYSFCNES